MPYQRGNTANKKNEEGFQVGKMYERLYNSLGGCSTMDGKFVHCLPVGTLLVVLEILPSQYLHIYSLKVLTDAEQVLMARGTDRDMYKKVG